MIPATKALAVAVTASLLAGACAAQPAPKARRPAPRPATVGPVLPAPPPLPMQPVYSAWGNHTVASRVASIGPNARRRWKPYFQAAGTSYPPWTVVLAAFKRERRIEVYAGPSPWELSPVRDIHVLAASGGPGPKLREGDRQVPEGIYSIEKLNPNSLFHVALKLDYPNDFDRLMGRMDGRRNLGGQIMIHGSDQSIGCLAVGDLAAEDLFVLAADAGIENVTVVIAPYDFRRAIGEVARPTRPSWVRELYAGIERKLDALPLSAPATASDPQSGPVGDLSANRRHPGR